jgi:hypothetical protein
VRFSNFHHGNRKMLLLTPIKVNMFKLISVIVSLGHIACATHLQKLGGPREMGSNDLESTAAAQEAALWDTVREWPAPGSVDTNLS